MNFFFFKYLGYIIKILNDKARNNNKPWLTKGILKSCKKKNKLSDSKCRKMQKK